MNKRVALISEHASPLAVLGGVDSGGQNVYVMHVARHLAALGYQIDVFTRRDDEELPEVVNCGDNFRVIHVPAGPPAFIPKEELLQHMPAFTTFVEEQCRRNRYDLLHANFFMSGLVAADVKKRLNIPFVITFHALGRVRRIHQGADDHFADERFEIEARIVAEADQIIAECPQDEEDLIQLYGADPHKISIIPAGFDPAEFGPLDKTLARIALGLPLRERLVLQLGRMVPRKGVETVIRGIAHLHKNHHIAARLIVVGGESEWPDPALTPEIGRLQGITDEENIGDFVTFVGRRKRDVLKYYYSAADVFVSVPWYEPFGMTPVEAMACATPVIGAAVGGIKHTVKDGETGYLIPPKDPQILGEVLARVFSKPEILERLGEDAVRRVNQKFTWSVITKAISELYEAVCSPIVSELQAVHIRQAIAGRSPIPQNGNYLQLIDQGFADCLKTVQRSRRMLPEKIWKAAEAISACFSKGGKVLICGNGGSAAEAQHTAAELVGRFKKLERLGLPAVALTSDGAVVTAWSNDHCYEDVFARQVQALGKPGDLLIGISTSGRSANVVQAFKMARSLHLGCVALVGGDGGDMLEHADIAIVAPSDDPQRIQETQLLILHLLCELVEEQVDGKPVPAGAMSLPALNGAARCHSKDVLDSTNGHRWALERRPQ